MAPFCKDEEKYQVVDELVNQVKEIIWPLIEKKLIDIKIFKGQMLGVVGVIGSGKTTLAQMLLRFYDPTAGTLLIGGHPITEIPLQKLRGSIGYVSQEPFLFSTSIRDNIVISR